MTELKQIYKCELCGNMVEMVHPGAGELVCCGKEMTLLMGNIVDAAVEKHVPVVEKTGKELKVRVGEVAHPMDEGHFIEWIEVLTSDKVLRCHLEPGQEPVALFELEDKEAIEVRAYCNLHGLWKNDDAIETDVITEEEIAVSN